VGRTDPLSHSVYSNNAGQRRQREQESCDENISFRAAYERLGCRKYQAKHKGQNRRPGANREFPWDETRSKEVSMALFEELEIFIGVMKAGKFNYSRHTNQ
jgi:hypothetical protein